MAEIVRRPFEVDLTVEVLAQSPEEAASRAESVCLLGGARKPVVNSVRAHGVKPEDPIVVLADPDRRWVNKHSKTFAIVEQVYRVGGHRKVWLEIVEPEAPWYPQTRSWELSAWLAHWEPEAKS